MLAPKSEPSLVCLPPAHRIFVRVKKNSSNYTFTCPIGPVMFIQNIIAKTTLQLESGRPAELCIMGNENFNVFFNSKGTNKPAYFSHGFHFKKTDNKHL